MNRKWILLLASVMLLLAVITVGYSFMNNGERSAGEVIFTRAEELYNSDKHLSAAKYYQLFLQQKDLDENSRELATQRIAEIDRILSNKTLIEGLIGKALTSYEKKNYLLPEEDNATSYTIQILQLDPENSTALQLRESMLEYYIELAEKAEKRRRYTTAISNYENALRIAPENQDIHQRRNSLMAAAELR